MRVTLIAVTRPLYSDGDPRRLVEVAVKTSAGKVKEKGWLHYLVVKRDDNKLNKWLIDASEKFPTVLEHVVLTFMIEGCSRVCTHQLVRHRIASYTQESQRYSLIEHPEKVKELVEKAERWIADGASDKAKEVLSEVFVFPKDFDRWRWPDQIAYLNMLTNSLMIYARLVEAGVPSEDARFVIPQSVVTRIMMTVNLRELLHIACLRTSPHAQWEIRDVVNAMIKEVKTKLNIPIDAMMERYCKNNY